MSPNCCCSEGSTMRRHGVRLHTFYSIQGCVLACTPSSLHPLDAPRAPLIAPTLNLPALKNPAYARAGPGEEGYSEQPRARRLRWTPELHTAFLSACNALGGPHLATPKQILTAMNVPGGAGGRALAAWRGERAWGRRAPAPWAQQTVLQQATGRPPTAAAAPAGVAAGQRGAKTTPLHPLTMWHRDHWRPDAAPC